LFLFSYCISIDKNTFKKQGKTMFFALFFPFFLFFLCSLQGMDTIELTGISISKSELMPVLNTYKIEEITIDQDTRKLLPQMANALKEHLNALAVYCDIVWFSSSERYIIIDVVEKGDEKRIQCRVIPQRSIACDFGEVFIWHEELYKGIFALIKAGKSVEERWNGHLDFADEYLHAIAEKLAKHIPQCKDILLEILEHDSDDQKRKIAASLLNWSLGEYEKTLGKVMVLLDDPHSEVRNNISRFILQAVQHEGIKSASLRRDLITHLVKQLSRPSHGDRNKSIYALLFLAQKYPEERAYIKEQDKLIKSIAETSILPNVNKPACLLLSLLTPYT
jgi:hypothetical protein